MSKEFNRREFIGLGTVAAAGLLIGCESKKRSIEIPLFRDQAPDGQPLKAAVVGCGGRGSGAAVNFLNAERRSIFTSKTCSRPSLGVAFSISETTAASKSLSLN